MKNTTLNSNYLFVIKKIFVITLLTFIYNVSAHAISWGAFTQRNGNDVTIQWGWQYEDNESVICFNSSGCIVTIGPFDVRGANVNDGTSGGINFPYGMIQKVTIPNNGTAKDAFNLWKSKYGTANTQKLINMWGNYPRTDFKSVCYGFQIFQTSTSGTSYGALLPNAGCGVVPPSNVSCSFNFPSSINLGSAISNQNGSWSGEANGTANCTDLVDIRANLLATPYLSNLPVDISINTTKLDNSNKLVAQGKTMPLNFKATTTGKFTSAGNFKTNAVIVFSFN